MYGIFINCKTIPFIDYILIGAKQYETRSRNMLSRLLGERVALIETGKGRAIIRGYATIDRYTTLYHNSLDARKSAWIFGTPYDIPDGGKKVFYHLKNVARCRPYELPDERINHGRAYTEFFV